MSRNDSGFKIGDHITWRIVGAGKRYEVEGDIIAFIPRNTSGYAKLPKDAYDKRNPKAKQLAVYRVRGKDVNSQNDRFIVKSKIGDNVFFYFPTTTKLINQSHEE